MATVATFTNANIETIKPIKVLSSVNPSDSEKSGLIITHAGLKTRYGYNLKTSKVIGNTGGFLMINRLLFDKIGK